MAHDSIQQLKINKSDLEQSLYRHIRDSLHEFNLANGVQVSSVSIHLHETCRIGYDPEFILTAVSLDVKL